MSAWAGVDIAAVREAVQRRDGTLVHLELDHNLFGNGEALVRVTAVDPMNPRRKPSKVLPGPLIGDDHAALLRVLADVLDGTCESLIATERDRSES